MTSLSDPVSTLLSRLAILSETSNWQFHFISFYLQPKHLSANCHLGKADKTKSRHCVFPIFDINPFLEEGYRDRRGLFQRLSTITMIWRCISKLLFHWNFSPSQKLSNSAYIHWLFLHFSCADHHGVLFPGFWRYHRLSKLKERLVYQEYKYRGVH